jgi:hypothetical protein
MSVEQTRLRAGLGVATARLLGVLVVAADDREQPGLVRDAAAPGNQL